MKLFIYFTILPLVGLAASCGSEKKQKSSSDQTIIGDGDVTVPTTPSEPTAPVPDGVAKTAEECSALGKAWIVIPEDQNNPGCGDDLAPVKPCVEDLIQLFPQYSDAIQTHYDNEVADDNQLYAVSKGADQYTLHFARKDDKGLSYSFQNLPLAGNEPAAPATSSCSVEQNTLAGWDTPSDSSGSQDTDLIDQLFQNP